MLELNFKKPTKRGIRKGVGMRARNEMGWRSGIGQRAISITEGVQTPHLSLTPLCKREISREK